jgi:hypothetical protein
MGRAFDRAEYTPPYAAMAASGLQINGNFEIAQELLLNTQVTIPNASTKYVADQWQCQYAHGANTAVFKGQVAGPGGAHLGNSGNYLEMIATTPSAMAAGGDFAMILQPIEGLRWAKLSYGASVAKSVVISFWAFATIAGTATLAVRNAGNNRSYLADFTINTPNTFEYKSVIVPGDITGTWVATTAMSTVLSFCFGGNTNYNGISGTWQGTNSIKTTATTNFFATANNRVVLAGVTIMPGSDIPSQLQAPLLQRTLPEEILLCQRYYEKSHDLGLPLIGTTSSFLEQYVVSGIGNYQTTSIPFKVRKRASPGLTFYPTNGGAAGNIYAQGAGVIKAASLDGQNEFGFAMFITMTAADLIRFNFAADARM